MFKRFFIMWLLLLSTFVVNAAEEADHAIHEELRGLVQGIEQAINTEKYAELQPFFHEKMRVTTSNQEVIFSRPEIVTYFNKWFGADGKLKKLHISLTPDALTELYGNNTFGVVHGLGVEDYIVASDNHYEMETRWTATVIKDTDGKWRVLTLHIGTNFLDNPILTEAEASLLYFAGGGLLMGLLLSGLIGFIVSRLKRKRDN